MRRSPAEEGKRWLDQASEDLRWAQDLARRGGYHIACFLAQQVAEKALKAFLYAMGEEVVLGHSVNRLCDEASRHDESFAEKGRRWSIPDGIPAEVYTADAAKEAVGLAAEVVEFVRGKIGG